MKRYRYLIPALFWMLVGCAELDLAPEDNPSDATFFTQETDFLNFMNGRYPSFSPGFTWRGGEASSDNFVENNEPNGTIYQWNNTGVADATSNTWNNNYTNIRNVNYLLDNVGKLAVRTTPANQYIGEAFYARAHYYFNLLQAFGGVPYIDRALGTEDPDLYKPRDSRDFLAGKIIQDLDSAIALMQWKGDGPATPGRLNKESALVLKSRVGLFEGSWEYYHGREGTPFAVSGSDGSQFLQEAVEAGQMLIDNGITLFKGRPDFEYTDVFSQVDYSNVAGAYFWKAYDNDLGLPTPLSEPAVWGSGSPTKSAVDNFLLSDGLPEGLSSVAYDYTDMPSLINARDPRLNNVIYSPARGGILDFNGSQGLDVGSEGQLNNPYAYLLGAFVTSHGGYMTFKWRDKEIVGRGVSNTDRLILRAAEGMMNFAEAKAILGTISQTDIDNTVNVIRDRVGMAHMNLADVNSWAITYSVKDGYDPSATNILNEIRRERRVELYLDGFRNSDLKRWAIYEDVINGYKPRGAYFQELQDWWDDEDAVTAAGWPDPAAVKLIPGTNVNVLGEYINPLWRSPDFEDESARGYFIDPNRDYLESIPTNEIEFYSNSEGVTLAQNPGWL